MNEFAEVLVLDESNGTYDKGDEVLLNTSYVISVCRHDSRTNESDVFIVCMAGVDDSDNGWLYVDAQSAANITGRRV